MSLSVPALLKGVIAASGDKNDIPLNATTAGAADYTKGFPPITQLPLASGGIAPDRWDFNGLFNILSQHAFWQQSGGLYTWDAALDYPVPALVVGSDGDLYRSLLASGPSGVGAKDPISNPTYWTQAVTIGEASETVAGILKLATQAMVDAGTDGAAAVTSATLAARMAELLQNASQTVSGLARFATMAEAAALTDATLALSPATIGKTILGPLTNPGWIQLPNGLIIQGGNYSATASDARNITLPIAFPNIALACSHSHGLSASGYAPKAGFSGLTTIQIGSDFWTSGTNPTIQHTWVAIGY